MLYNRGDLQEPFPPPPWEGKRVRLWGVDYFEVSVPIVHWLEYKEKYGIEIVHVKNDPRAPLRFFIRHTKEG
jgi:hypothetical protein